VCLELGVINLDLSQIVHACRKVNKSSKNGSTNSPMKMPRPKMQSSRSDRSKKPSITGQLQSSWGIAGNGSGTVWTVLAKSWSRLNSKDDMPPPAKPSERTRGWLAIHSLDPESSRRHSGKTWDHKYYVIIYIYYIYIHIRLVILIDTLSSGLGHIPIVWSSTAVLSQLLQGAQQVKERAWPWKPFVSWVWVTCPPTDPSWKGMERDG